MTRDDWQEFMEWLIWSLIFGGIIAGTLWLLVVR
jgi:hypothetical protein